MIADIDTNVLVSAYLRGRKPKAVVEFISESLQYEWVVSIEILNEYIEVLQRKKFRFNEQQIQEWLRTFSGLRVIDDSETMFNFPKDPKDEKFFRCTIAADADFLITGDRHFKGISQIETTKIFSVSEFFRIEMSDK